MAYYSLIFALPMKSKGKFHFSVNRLKALSIHMLAVICCLLFATAVNAQAKFYASAPKSVPVNANFQLSFTLENANGSNLKLPPMNDFTLLGGPSTSSNMQWINGNVTQSVTYTYVLRPKKEGTLKIGKASIQVSGVNMESNEDRLTVEKTLKVRN